MSRTNNDIMDEEYGKVIEKDKVRGSMASYWIFLLFLWVLSVNGFNIPVGVWVVTVILAVLGTIAITVTQLKEKF